MTTITDPQTWLTALPGPCGPTRGQYVQDRIQYGDVTDQGEILVRDGVTLAAGCTIVELHQAYEASYYGWADSGMRVRDGGRVLTQIYRDL
jgi:hypothetical protein